jgi:hypothetical protein
VSLCVFRAPLKDGTLSRSKQVDFPIELQYSNCETLPGRICRTLKREITVDGTAPMPTAEKVNGMYKITVVKISIW